MLSILQRIVQEVGSAEDLGQALDTIVARVRGAMGVDMCSVYLSLQDQQLTLMATEGLNPRAKRAVDLDFSEGLVGLVAQRAEPINLEDAPTHERFKYVPEIGEEVFHAFLGVPIIHHRKLLGVLIVQSKDTRRFNEDDAAFLITLAAQLASAISHAEMSGEFQSLRDEAGRDVYARGIAGAPCVAVGSAVVLYNVSDLHSVPDRKIDDHKREVRDFKEAISRVQAEMMALKEGMGKMLPTEDRVLFDAYVLLSGSDTLVERTVERIRAGNWAPGALRETIVEHARIFEEMEDSYLRERASDIRDIGHRILTHLQNADAGPAVYPEKTILIGEDLSLSQLAEIPSGQLAGIVSERGSSSSHVAILSRALGLPAVMGVTDLPVSRLHGREVVVDGYAGNVLVQPSDQVRAEYVRLAEEERQLAEGLTGLSDKPAETPDGVHIPVYVNSGLIADTHAAFQAGSDGVGLYRTELPFMVRERFPSEEEQYHIYREVLKAMSPRPVVLRTLDVGGDKDLPYFPVEEDNPFLGWRGIRIALDHPEIFLTQLRAMLRASVGFGNLSIMLPMISSVSEVDESLALLFRARMELEDEYSSIPEPKTGVMIEVPSAVYLAETLARRVDFLSVGTNDLVQYLLAVDRNNARVADLYVSLHPAVLRALLQIVKGAHNADTPVSVCGEMAGDPASVILLMGMGIDALSVSVPGLPKVKWIVRTFAQAHARELFERAMEFEDPVEIRKLLNDALVEAGLGGLVRAGKH
ncbi:MAG: phosphoenolpyruvate--protein phosphotransferase [Gammaproteobacteria bacterium]